MSELAAHRKPCKPGHLLERLPVEPEDWNADSRVDAAAAAAAAIENSTSLWAGPTSGS